MKDTTDITVSLTDARILSIHPSPQVQLPLIRLPSAFDYDRTPSLHVCLSFHKPARYETESNTMNRIFHFLLRAAIALSAAAPVAAASFLDADPDTPGLQTASWPEPSTIKVYIPVGLVGEDRVNFEMGIRIWDACLPNIVVEFEYGEPPGDTGVDVDLSPPGSLVEGGTRRFGVTSPDSTGPDGAPHRTIVGGLMRIDTDALGNAIFMQNLGAHEFGHALGLDEYMRLPGTMRTTVMDPEFDMTSPFIGLSATDKMMIGEHYSVRTPEAGSQWGLLAFGAFGLILLKRFLPKGDVA